MVTTAELERMKQQIEQQKVAQAKPLSKELQQKFEQRQLVAQQQYQRKLAQYNQQLTQYVKQMKEQGYNPVYSNGQLTGFEDTKRQMSIPLQNIDRYVEDIYQKDLAEYNRQIEQFKQTGDVPPKWFDIKPGQSLLERWRGIIPSERLAYETEKLITKLKKGPTPKGSDLYYEQLAETVIRGVGQTIPAFVERPYEMTKTAVVEQPVATAATIGGLLFSAGGLPQVGLPLIGAGAVYPYRKEILKDPFGTAGKISGDFLTGYLAGEAIKPIVKPIVTKLKTIGAGKEFPIKTIDIDGQLVRVMDVVDPTGKPVRILIQEGAYAASEKPAVVQQLKYAAEAKGQRFFTHAANKPIKTLKYPDGTIGFDVGVQRGLYFAPESLQTAKGLPQAYTYYTELGGQVRDISYPSYLFEKYVLGKKLEVAKPGSRAVLYVLERDFPDMPGWVRESLVKQGRNLSPSTQKSINYWSKRFDIDNAAKLPEVTNVIKQEILRQANPSSSLLKAAKAIYWENVVSKRGVIGGPEFLNLPYGPEWQLIEPFGKQLEVVSPTFREKALRTLGIQRGKGFGLLDQDIIDVQFVKQKKIANNVGSLGQPALQSTIDSISNSLTGEIVRPERIRVKTRVSAPKVVTRTATREERDLQRWLTAPQRPTPVKFRERPQQPRVREPELRLPDLTIRPQPRRPEKPRPTPDRPRPIRPRPRPPIFTLVPVPPIYPPRRRPQEKKYKKVKKIIKRKIGERGYILEPTLYGQVERRRPKRRKKLSQITGFELLR